MNCGICVCVLVAALSSICLGYPSTHPQGAAMPASAQTDPVLTDHTRQARSAPLGDRLKALPGPGVDESSRASLSELLAQLLSRKGTSRRSSTRASHRVQDRDYLGWMDFGRRSAEEYEYSS